MAFRMNLDLVEYREPSTRAIRWLICPSRRKQIIRLRAIGVRSPIDCCALQRLSYLGKTESLIDLTAAGTQYGLRLRWRRVSMANAD